MTCETSTAPEHSECPLVNTSLASAPLAFKSTLELLVCELTGSIHFHQPGFYFFVCIARVGLVS